MLPIGPLMIEHRLIERMVTVMGLRVREFDETGKADVDFIDEAVDFIRTYADRCHHGKEEDILFRELAKKALSDEHRQVMKDLIGEHAIARDFVRNLTEARLQYAAGDETALEKIKHAISYLVDFYPRHIEKEDKRFFMPVMGYFTTEEKGKMLEEGFEFDRNLIHARYRDIVERNGG
ncbi:MAG: hemerythrin domain-containing protein [Deltaproteobacteria bacterium]|nr:hemerythrin domain-containing protein [Deltaproteobacteria bacterium]